MQNTCYKITKSSCFLRQSTSKSFETKANTTLLFFCFDESKTFLKKKTISMEAADR